MILQTCAFVSLLTGATVPTNVAMTGEVLHFSYLEGIIVDRSTR